MKLFPHQAEAVEWLSKLKRAMLCHEMGLGKTATSIRAADAVHAKRIVVLCPAVAKNNWKNEFKAWGSLVRPIHVCNGPHDLPPAGPCVYIVNYDRISSSDSRPLRAILKSEWDVLIMDEAHFLKGKSNRSKAVYGRNYDGKSGIVSKAKHAWALTGTPAPNHVGELYNHIKAMWPAIGDKYMNRDHFERENCIISSSTFGTKTFSKIVGSKQDRVKVLRDQLSPFLNRKRKLEVLTSMPPLLFSTYVTEPDNSPDLSKAFEDLVQGGEGQDVLEHIQKNAVHLSTARRVIGMSKVKPVVELVINDLEADPESKIVIFGVHNQVVDALYTALSGFNPVVIDGRTSQKDRDKAIQAFQEDAKCRVFIGSITAAGTAITLTAASNVIFCEADWVPANNAQAAARCHRIGQRNAVTARFITVDHPVDKLVHETLVRKSNDIAALLD